jgi:hypothetical protein
VRASFSTLVQACPSVGISRFPTLDPHVFSHSATFAELQRLIRDLNAVERFWRHEHTHHFRHMIRPALFHREKRGGVVLARNLNQFANGDFIIAARSASCREDQVRLTYAPVRILLAIDYVEKTTTHGFDCDT